MLESAPHMPDELVNGHPPGGGLALVRRAVSPRLRDVTRDYWGYAEQTGAPLRRRELPSADVIVIVNLGEPLLVEQPRSAVSIIPTGGGFVAGLHETYAVTETAGSQAGVELRLSPLGAYRLLGVPMDALSNRSVAFDALRGPWAVELAERLQGASTWDARFAILDTALATQLSAATVPSPDVIWAWRQLVASGGRVPIATLEELVWSPKRLIARFREQIGLPPKQAARLLRFQRATTLIAAAGSPDWGAVARSCGYYDQSHLIHEFQRFAGDTPEGLSRRRLATGGGFAAD
ncbi:MAG: helix-turn-helix domain-containing protein [Chloroflexi bacterium]|nr:helix-turn-helix domain-containing protein [Chloroflexota bacterium]